MPQLSPLELLQTYFGFSQFRAGQEHVIDELLNGSGRSLAIFPTGGGKSLCYQLPALALEGTTLVVSPLLALMKDQIDFLQNRGIAAARLDSTLDGDQTREVTRQLRNGELKLLYVAPERFNNERFRELLRGTKLSLFAIDEAHCISEWGHNFRPDYLKLAQFVEELQVPRLLALTATATPQVATSICKSFGIEAQAMVNTGFYRPNLRLCLTPTTAERRGEVLLGRLQKRPRGSTVIYVTLQKTAENVAEFLIQNGLEARAYHAGMEAIPRAEIQDWWMASPERIVVATIAFGMGIDKSDVRYVYHYNLPKGLENYAQEIGRAGRDGQPSIVELLACPDDVATLENFVYGDTPTFDALHSLVQELMESGEEFAIKEYDLSQKHDLRPLVLRTTLTYLELMGIFRQGTPFYAGYDVQPLQDWDEIYTQFSPKAADFLRKLVGISKMGRLWLKVDSEDATEKLGCKRENVVRAMELLEEKGLALVRASDVRQRYARTPVEADATQLAYELEQRFARRESSEITRINQVLELVEHNGCQTNALVGYFGEGRPQPCGHCSFCITQRPAKLPPARELPPLETAVDVAKLADVRAGHPKALGKPRQVARFLCGLSSPAMSKARLTSHPLFSSLEKYRFAEVLAWCEDRD